MQVSDSPFDHSAIRTAFAELVEVFERVVPVRGGPAKLANTATSDSSLSGFLEASECARRLQELVSPDDREPSDHTLVYELEERITASQRTALFAIREVVVMLQRYHFNGAVICNAETWNPGFIPAIEPDDFEKVNHALALFTEAFPAETKESTQPSQETQEGARVEGDGTSIRQTESEMFESPGRANVQFKRQPETEETARFQHSPDFRSVCWGCIQFSFTKTQALCVEFLYDQWKQSTPEVSHDAIFAQLGDSNCERVRDLFKTPKGQHPAWDQMICRGNTRGTLQFVLPQNES
jgi:hypothetical protein